MNDHRPGPTPPGLDAETETALANVSSALWRVRELLDLLTFKLEEEQALLAVGRARWLGRATYEVELVLEEIRHAELRRVVELGPVTEALGLEPTASLREVAAVAPSPWDDVLTDHRNALVSATAEITALAGANRDLLEGSYRAVQEAMGRYAENPEGPTYTAAGAPAAQPAHRLFDQSS